MKTVAIIPGFAEGKWHAKRLRAALEKHGYSIVPKLSEADIVLAHSGGFFTTHKAKKTALIVGVGVPLKKRTQLAGTLRKKVAIDIKTHAQNKKLRQWGVKAGWNGYYTLRHPMRWGRMLRYIERLPSHTRVLIIRNKDDYFSSKGELQKLTENKNWHFAELPGQHDDLWTNSEHYIDIIKEYE